MKETDQEITGHTYDGIKEYDNPLPMWWLLTFLGAIIFAFIYYIHYEIGGADTQAIELKKDMALIEELKAKAPKKSLGSEDELIALFAKSDNIEKGKAAYLGKCAACHGSEGQGGIGPNLTDEFWLHTNGKATGLVSVIETGVGDKGMPPWKGILQDDEIIAVAGFINSLKGTKPANAKAPQGEKF